MEHTSPTDETLVERTYDLLTPAAASGFDPATGGVAPRFSAPAKAGRARIGAVLPATAAGGVSLTDPRSGITATFAPQGIQAVADSAEGYLVYPDAVGKSEHLVRRVDEDGIEDFVNLESAPGTSQLTYTVTLGKGVAGLRLVENVVELLDAGGVPRLRVPEPFLVDSLGKKTLAALSVSGCAVDTSPADPVGRSPIAPGATSCTLKLQWSSTGVVYPALVDPSFTLTGSMPAARWDHLGVTMGNGSTLVIGGWLQAGAYLYNPVSGTWSVTGTPIKSRDNAVAVLLQNGTVLYAGGYSSGTQNAAELYQPVSGTWVATGTMVDKIEKATANLLSNGKVLVAGGFKYVSNTNRNYTNRAELYDPNTGAWSLTGSMATARAQHASAVLPIGRVLVVSGNSAWPSDTPTSTCELFDPATGVWSSGGTLSNSRYRARATVLPYLAKVLVSGGYGGGTSSPIATTEVYDGGSNSWSAGPPMASPRAYHGAALAANGRVLLAGGFVNSGTTATSSTEEFDPATGTLSSGLSLNVARASFSLTVSGVSGTTWQMLIAGGYTPGNSSSSTAEIYDAAPSPQASVALGDSAALPPLTAYWSLYNQKGSVAASTNLGFAIANNSAATRSVRVDLVATGLDDRAVRRASVATATIAANSSQSFSIPASWLPVQSIGNESEVVLSAREYDIGTGVDTGLVVPSDPLYYEFVSGYATVILHGIEGVDLDRTQPSQSTTAAQLFTSMGGMLTGLLTRQGRVWDDTLGGFADVGSLAKPGGSGFTYSQGYVARGQWTKDAAALKGSFVVAYTPPPGAPTRKLCTRWRARYIDTNRGDDYLNPTNPGDPNPKLATIVESPARFASAFLTTGVSPVDVVWSGFLDADGCVSIKLGAGDFDLFWFSSMQKGTTKVDVSLGKKGMNGSSSTSFAYSSNPPFVVATFGVDGIGTSDIVIAEGNDDFVSRVASVVSLTLAQADSGLANSATYTIEANNPCEIPEIPAGCGGNSCNPTLPNTCASGYSCVGTDPNVPTIGQCRRACSAGCSPGNVCNTSTATCTQYLGACGSGNPSPSDTSGSLLVGYNVGQIPDPVRGVTHNSSYKNVIAHEFGHSIHGTMSGGFFFDLSDKLHTPQTSDPINPCRCDYITGSNTTHCLQSREREAWAAAEGFAHFNAARLFNDPTQTNCKFVYYKQALIYQGGIGGWGPSSPPNPSECYSPVQWMQTNCATNAMSLALGNEWDYLGFFYQMNRTSATPYTLADLAEVFRRACSGLPSGTCGGSKCSPGNNIVNYDKLQSGTGGAAKTLKQAACELATAQVGQSGCVTAIDKAKNFADQGLNYRITWL